MASFECLRGKTVLVTGSGRGVGRQIAQSFAAQGAQVAICDLVQGRADETGALIEQAGGTAMAQAADVGDEPSVQRLVAAIVERWGHIDVLVNAAGSYGAAFRRTHETPVAEWDGVFASNVRGSFLCAKAVLPGMMARKAGRIINVSSNAGRSVSPLLGCSYTAAKTAIIGLTRHLAHEYARDGILVNTIAPGPVRSERVTDLIGEDDKATQLAAQIPLGRLAEPTDIADVVLFMASDASRFMTGAILDVSGGYVLA
jgi:3-oxoacyl-[acyl-carrier protein] reductase